MTISACSLGACARAEASERHAPERVLSKLLDVYENAIAHDKELHDTEAVPRS